MQCVAVRCSMQDVCTSAFSSQSIAVCCSVLHSVVQCVRRVNLRTLLAVNRSALQCHAVCCSMLQCVRGVHPFILSIEQKNVCVEHDSLIWISHWVVSPKKNELNRENRWLEQRIYHTAHVQRVIMWMCGVCVIIWIRHTLHMCIVVNSLFKSPIFSIQVTDLSIQVKWILYPRKNGVTRKQTIRVCPFVI